eukprot:128284_1
MGTKTSKHPKDKEENMKRELGDSRNDKKAIRIILLGTGAVGKSTLLNQILHIMSWIPNEEIERLTSFIKEIVIEYMQILCRQSIELHTKQDREQIYVTERDKSIVTGFIRNFEKELPENKIIPPLITQLCVQYFGNNQRCTLICKDDQNLQNCFDYITNYAGYGQNHNRVSLDMDIAKKIEALWNDPGIKETFRLRHIYKYQFHDNADHFLNKVMEIADDKYSPDFEDLINLRRRTCRFEERSFKANVSDYGAWKLRIASVGSDRSGRRKWHVLAKQNIDLIIFVFALTDYSKLMFEDQKTNRFHDSLQVFECLCNASYETTRWFVAYPRIIILNKYDAFKQLIVDIPITECFDDFPANKSPYNEQHAIEFISEKIEQCSNAKEHFICMNVLDTENVKIVFQQILEDLVRSKLMYQRRAWIADRKRKREEKQKKREHKHQ